MKAKITKIEIEDFGTEFANAVIALADAKEKSLLKDRAFALLLRDQTGINLTDCLEVIKALPRLREHYLKK